MRPTWQRVLLTVLYWVAVLVVSIAILVALVLLIESRDQAEVEEGGSVTLVA
ncbi:MAG TPA: hypothetical protein VF712_03070 [Thermoleophilaceae bacterium]|jgi:hypothetical protein